MSRTCCGGMTRRMGRVGRVGRPASWVVSAAVLLLIPKCPACLAAYVVAATGVSLSTVAAGWLRVGLIAGSLTALATLSMAVLWRWRPRPDFRGANEPRT